MNQFYRNNIVSFSGILWLIFIALVPLKGVCGDTLRINSFPGYLHVHTKFTYSFSEVEIANPAFKHSLELMPNVGNSLNLGFYYSWLGLGYSFGLPATDAMNQKYGNTNRHDLEAHIMMRKLMVDLSLKKYEGYYFSNPQDFIQDWDNTSTYPQIPDLTTKSLSASFAYVFSPDRYSVKAAYSLTESMQRSGGSWMIGGFVSRSSIYSDSIIIPLLIKQHVDPKFDLKKISFNDYGISFGYSHFFTIKKKNFISFTLLPGLALQEIAMQSCTDGSLKEDNAVSFRSMMHFSMGHNGDKYYAGIKGYLQSSTVKNKDTELDLALGNVQFFIGYRFNTTKWQFMKGVDKLLHPRFLRFLTGPPPARE